MRTRLGSHGHSYGSVKVPTSGSEPSASAVACATTANHQTNPSLNERAFRPQLRRPMDLPNCALSNWPRYVRSCFHRLAAFAYGVPRTFHHGKAGAAQIERID